MRVISVKEFSTNVCMGGLDASTMEINKETYSGIMGCFSGLELVGVD